MKKKAIAIAVALAGFATAAQAAPESNTWYTGAKLGWSQYHDAGFYGGRLGWFENSDGPTRKSDLGAGAYLGYQANQYLGFELGYDWLGRVKHKGATKNGAFKAQGIQLAAKLSYPVMENLDVYTRLGGMAWRADSKFNSADTKISGHDTGVSPMAAVGVEYALTDSLSTRLDYQWVNNIGDAGTVGSRPDNTMLALGISYNFGQNGAGAAAGAGAIGAGTGAALNTTRSTDEGSGKHFKLESDVMFNFNQSKLKPEGRQALNQLYSQLSSMDPKDGAVIAVGHTDRIGSEAYNQKLSQQRARAVVKYLMAKGVPSDKISMRGVGKANSVTGTKCDGVKGRAALINCLAPDRRVEIEVKGISDVVSE